MKTYFFIGIICFLAGFITKMLYSVEPKYVLKSEQIDSSYAVVKVPAIYADRFIQLPYRIESKQSVDTSAKYALDPLVKDSVEVDSAKFYFKDIFFHNKTTHYFTPSFVLKEIPQLTIRDSVTYKEQRTNYDNFALQGGFIYLSKESKVVPAVGVSYTFAQRKSILPNLQLSIMYVP